MTSDSEEFGVQNTSVLGAIQIMPKQHRYDIGTISDAPSTQEIMKLVRLGHLPHPELFPKDYTGQIFSIFVLPYKSGEKLPHEWLVFSPSCNIGIWGSSFRERAKIPLKNYFPPIGSY